MLNEIEVLTAVALTIFFGIVIGGLVLSLAAIVGARMESAARREYERSRL
ncbi:hypothetical protein BN2497_10497 [Janthinobacterium sp. CG23_2]|nr:hypothetical protein BN2497_39 [Janthinobacterium sp. CG23_2]CUI03893.1 hypothetical protein BN2497_2563 [Janthinobacterium sp. CG23_2]CUI07860.1 hypothetical protein BN2497_10497 [Janthinobacterium sp. CG23_2]CUU26417.1 hypothetical protein BN3177_39 [Janthinobacterium sp. CG23_2]CUU27679.1 hypothetical protein BN3177_2563 [Janthinobacterium sp. CG23_2]